ncbi:hypothetical protein HU200_047593 [Digitaria exilis]|uniref:Uncharacterized protein n=1 Tax=Digitaria exilis TaxID=1010633 RepID=A0A835EBV9_9POAL|nr:hypothetical protein HU200_047593 [Digitaria exilis]
MSTCTGHDPGNLSERAPAGPASVGRGHRPSCVSERGETECYKSSGVWPLQLRRADDNPLRQISLAIEKKRAEKRSRRMEAQLDYSPLAGEDEAAISAATGDEGDDVKLRLLGYKRQLKRDLSQLRASVVSNFAVTFSIVSVLTGVTTLFGTGLQFGGPVTMVYGWPIAGAFTLAVGLAMAEICSAYPTSGGLYFWSARLCTHRRWGPFAAWLTGW